MLYEKASMLAQKLVHELLQKGYVLSLAESCTSGLVSAFIGDISGASNVFWGSFVCYSSQAKIKMLGIDKKILGQYGNVSRQTASEMAFKALQHSNVNIAAAVTGIAGPSGDGSDIPVGTVWIAAAYKISGGNSAVINRKEKEFHFSKTRQEIRLKAAIAVFEELLEILL